MRIDDQSRAFGSTPTSRGGEGRGSSFNPKVLLPRDAPISFDEETYSGQVVLMLQLGGIDAEDREGSGLDRGRGVTSGKLTASVGAIEIERQ